MGYFLLSNLYALERKSSHYHVRSHHYTHPIALLIHTPLVDYLQTLSDVVRKIIGNGLAVLF